ncbi:MAG TPA: hypothetical protein P5341_11330, partial [Hyphomonas sp.]|nr:hypothetical protein [Hyphomonas sp.]
MKRHLLAGAALIALAALSGCDAVRLPVFNPAESDTAVAAEADTGAQTEPDAIVAEAAADTTVEGETPTVDRGEGTDESALLSPASIVGGDADLVPPAQDTTTPSVSLAEFNAVTCGLPDTA